MFTSHHYQKDETLYQQDRRQYLKDFRDLEEFIRERELALSASDAGFKATPGTLEHPEDAALRSTQASPVRDAEFRVWTSASGEFTTEARLVDYDTGTATLENREGRQIKVRADKLSQGDREYIKEWQRRQH